MEDLIRIGVISCAEMSRRHMKAIVDNPKTELYYVCDIDPNEVAIAKAEYRPVKTTADYRDVINDPKVDAVLIITPDQTHREIAVAALEAGKHVLCEKPMALTVEDCKAMVDASKKTDKKFMIGQICRYTPGFVAAKELIDRGEIGELFFVESEYAHDYEKYAKPWRLDPLRHGFLGGGCHAVDLIRWIAGDPIEIMAYSNHKMLPAFPTDDCTISIMKFANGAVGKVFVGTGVKRNYTMRSVFYGTKGTIITDNGSKYMTVFKVGLGNGDSLLEGKTDYVIPFSYPVSIDSHNTAGELAEFLDCIINDKPVKTTGVEGAKTVITALAAVESTKTGLPVKPDYSILD